MSALPTPTAYGSPMINHRQIEAFRAVMISGTATGAAVLLHTSQPVISKLIARLQARTGIKLFELRKSRLTPTPEARILFKTIERTYVGLEHVEQTIAELRGTHAGSIHIGSLPSFGLGFLPGFTREYQRLHPDVKVCVETVNSNLIKYSVASGKLDMGIALRQIDTAGVHVESLVTVDTLCVMSPRDKLAGKSRIRVQDLHGHPFIAPSRDSAHRNDFDLLIEAHGIAPKIVAETTYAINTALLALHGVGVGLVSPFVVPDLLKAGLVAKPFEPKVPIELIVMSPLDSSLSRISETFLDMMKERLAAMHAGGAPGR